MIAPTRTAEPVSGAAAASTGVGEVEVTGSDDEVAVVHPFGAAARPASPDDVRRALVEQFLRNGDSGDDAANSDLVAAVCAGIRRAQDAARGGPGVS